jgi:hypothetical protein
MTTSNLCREGIQFDCQPVHHLYWLRYLCAMFVPQHMLLCYADRCLGGRLRLKCDGTRAETRFRLSAKRTSPFKSVGTSVWATTGSRGVRISGSNAGYTMFQGSVKSTGYPLHSPVSPWLPLPASPPAITFQLDSTYTIQTSVTHKRVIILRTLKFMIQGVSWGVDNV